MEEKLNYEYEVFVLDCLRQSKPGIFARSEEIEMKKEIVRTLKARANKDKVLEEKLLVLDNILEEAYRYVKDYKEQEKGVKALVEMWLLSINKKDKSS